MHVSEGQLIYTTSISLKYIYLIREEIIEVKSSRFSEDCWVHLLVRQRQTAYISTGFCIISGIIHKRV